MAYCCINQHHNEPGGTWCGKCDSLVAGALIGDYSVISHTGSGSSSDVYLAEQHSLNRRKVVIKILHRSCNQRQVNNFRHEAALFATLSHPYIMPIFSYGVIYERQATLTTSLPYLVLPFAEQGSLADCFVREGKRPWSLERVISLAREVAEALDHAHSRGVLHRDVKSANLLQMGAHVLLSDFSIASLIDVDSSHLTAGVAGSPAYMAPEVWAMRPGRYSDQYALAITCFFLLTGNYPLRRNGGASARSWQQLHCFVAPSALSEFRANMPLAVNFVLQRALAKDPHDRYPSVQAFANDLLVASQEITQHLIKAPALVGQSRVPRDPEPWGLGTTSPLAGRGVTPHPPPFPAGGGEEKDLRKGPPPIAQGRQQVEQSIVQQQDIHTESLNLARHNNKWIWYTLLLNLLICLVLAAEYSRQMGSVGPGTDLLLAAWPTLLVGPLLAGLFRRLSPATLSWGLFWGVFFGLSNALFCTLACFAWKACLFVMPFFGSAGGGLSALFKQALALELTPGPVELTLLALWMSVIGGALIGIFSVRDEGAVPLVHQGPQK
jgi:serine/threonine protein kinase